ncbi:MAG: helix-turn-helix transcriptional regulator [Phycisphaerae bacterium]
MPKKVSFADLMRRTVRGDGRSLYRIAKDSGVAVAILQRFMSGERGITLTTAEKVCRAIGLDLRPVQK